MTTFWMCDPKLTPMAQSTAEGLGSQFMVLQEQKTNDHKKHVGRAHFLSLLCVAAIQYPNIIRVSFIQVNLM